MADEFKIVLTEAEIKGGWTPDTLAAYLNERDNAASEAVHNKPPVVKSKANGNSNPHFWRGR